MQKKKIILEFDETDIGKFLESKIDNEDLLELIKPMIIENDKAVEQLFRIAAGLGLAKKLKPGTLVNIDVDNLAYNSATMKVEDIKKYNALNDKNEVNCMVTEFNGWHRYAPYKVTFKGPDDVDATANVSYPDMNKCTDI